MPLLEPGRAQPLGATVRDGGVNFALFSEHADAVELCVFDPSTGQERSRDVLPGRAYDVYHGFLPDAGPGLQYGYRVHGAYRPSAGHRFNPNKLLIDPYARALAGELRWDDAVYGYTRGHADADLSFDTRDSAPFVPRSVVREPISRRRGAPRPDVPVDDRVILEAHVKGLTQQFPGLDARRRGTYQALGSRGVIRYLESLGITTLELLPVHEFLDDHFLVEKGLANYWGYQSLAFMAPAARYGRDDPVRELADAVKALHRSGIEVFLDVVYNHSCEGNELGPTLCYRGIDNRSYYRLLDDHRYYINDTGTGNTFALEHPRVLQLVMDSLRFWAGEMRVDGFRFDLASALGRESHGFDVGSGFFDAVQQDPLLSTTTLIAEPWDIGPGGYQLGRYPVRWQEWNDRFRDTARRFWLRDEPVLPALSDALLGSATTFETPCRAPQSSVNLITAHDGFTLADLTRYDHKHNEANGEGNRDGHGENLSNNFGFEGDSDDPAVLAARARAQRNLLATLLLSQGTPMLLAGDESGRSQHGNNNAYCQDNPIGWLDWQASRVDIDLQRFTREALRLRRKMPVLRRTHWLHGDRVSVSSGLPEVTWLDVAGEPMQDEQWHAPGARFVVLQLLGDAEGSAPVSDHALLLINGGARTAELALDGPGLHPGPWEVVLDTAAADSVLEADTSAPTDRPTLRVAPGSMRLARCYTRSATI